MDICSCRRKFCLFKFLCIDSWCFHVFCHTNGGSYCSGTSGCRNGKRACSGSSSCRTITIIAKYACYPKSNGNSKNSCLCDPGCSVFDNCRCDLWHSIYFRHVGYFPEEELVKVLFQKGVK